jgi:hypothetical protein
MQKCDESQSIEPFSNLSTRKTPTKQANPAPAKPIQQQQQHYQQQ